ncbi:NfeD family protein [Hujiaoplasma nucleasis]|uniref:NfeD family protein n=1 Tax=Hujiaoplasma nucleasis TaxID=2725268 RepID=A0A7L6N4L0_9MOLU|nr:NfeD family protein [Hujiaoplasma nucleasis]QLY40432.1 NfeD family protein [Hujiaoplasma nucleasis]
MVLNIFTENYMIFIWFAIIIVAFFIEIETMDLSSIWFAAGAFIALIVSIFTESIWIQVIVFIVTSTLLLLSLRPIFKKYMNRNEIRTNASALIDQEAICIKPIIDNERGEVKIQGKKWTAISNENIYENERVIVLAISGVKLVVKRKK